MHNPFEPELSSGKLEFQLNKVFHYPPSKMIADGMPHVDLLPDDLQALIAADEVAPVVAHALNLEKSRRSQAEAETKSARLRLLRELTNSLASNQDLNDVLREVTDRTRRLMRSDFALLGLLDMESGRLQVNAFDLADNMLLEEEAVDALALKEALQESNSRLSTLEEAEREHVLRALRETNWVIGGPNGAAARLGLVFGINNLTYAWVRYPMFVQNHPVWDHLCKYCATVAAGARSSSP